MCGIAGAVDFEHPVPLAASVAAMSCALQHRGPDGEGLWHSTSPTGSVAFGHRRLAVIDLSERAAQPMHNEGCVEAGRAQPLVIVLNGEIYNYRELRSGLESRGHRLTSASDTEVVLHLYEEVGARCVDRLRGMFALAIWDAAKQELFCARDRVGKKPFYFASAGTQFWFASEPMSLVAGRRLHGDISDEVVRQYLCLGYVPGSRSAFRGISRLPAASCARVSREGVRIERYWRLAYEPKRRLSEAEALAELDRRLDESVRLRLISDVPAGVFLSGGVDSSLVAAYVTRNSPSPPLTFTIGSADPRFDERAPARLVASRFRTVHHELVVDAGADAPLDAIARTNGEPFGDSSALPTWHLARLVKPQITVALNGDGGDESFLGYSRYRAYRFLQRYERLPAIVRRGVSHAVRGVSRPASNRTLSYDLVRFFGTADMPPEVRYASWFGFFSPMDLQPAADDPLAPVLAAFRGGEDLHSVERAARADIETYLPDDLLVKVDRATMAHGVEGRSPLLDHLVMEFAASLPVSLKVPRGRLKSLLKRLAVRAGVPEAVLDRRKTGFGVPVDLWFRTSLRDMAADLLGAPGALHRRYLCDGVFDRVWQEHQQQRAAHGQRLWALLMLELWNRERLR